MRVADAGFGSLFGKLNYGFLNRGLRSENNTSPGEAKEDRYSGQFVQELTG
jgi:hypothetical protein